MNRKNQLQIVFLSKELLKQLYKQQSYGMRNRESNQLMLLNLKLNKVRTTTFWCRNLN